MTLSPAPATRAPRLTVAQPLRFDPRERTSEPGKKKINARGGRNRSVTSGLRSLSLGPGTAGTPGARQAGAGTRDNRPARGSGRPKVTEPLKSRVRGRLGGTAPGPGAPGPRAPDRATLTRRPRPSPATAAQATAATALYTLGCSRPEERGPQPEDQDGAAKHRGNQGSPAPSPSVSERGAGRGGAARLGAGRGRTRRGGAVTVAKGRAGSSCFPADVFRPTG
jgi:hypothetical protein